MIYYYYSLLLGLLGFFIGTSLHTIGTGSTSQSKIFWETENKESAFYASDHIIKIQSGEDATTRSNQTALRVPQKTDQAGPLQQNHISHQGNYQRNQKCTTFLKTKPSSVRPMTSQQQSKSSRLSSRASSGSRTILLIQSISAANLRKSKITGKKGRVFCKIIL